MARRALAPATLAVVQAVDAVAASGWVVGCSGGADSLALAWAAAHVGGRRGTAVRAVVVDHGLQGGSDAVAAGVVAVMGGFGLDAMAVRVEVAEVGAGPEASARDARYAALADAAGPGDRVLLGHTLDDQAETVLLGLARGSGVRSLAGMPGERDRYVRPLLGLRRTVTAEACRELGLTPWNDPHNVDPRFARVRVREAVLPVLERELGPGVAEALARTAQLARADADFIDRAVPSAPDDRMHCAWLAGLDPALRGRVVRDWLAASGAGDVGATHVAAVDRLVTQWRGQRGVDVPGGRVIRQDGCLAWRPLG